MSQQNELFDSIMSLYSGVSPNHSQPENQKFANWECHPDNSDIPPSYEASQAMQMPMQITIPVQVIYPNGVLGYMCAQQSNVPVHMTTLQLHETQKIPDKRPAEDIYEKCEYSRYAVFHNDFENSSDEDDSEKKRDPNEPYFVCRKNGYDYYHTDAMVKVGLKPFSDFVKKE